MSKNRITACAGTRPAEAPNVRAHSRLFVFAVLQQAAPAGYHLFAPVRLANRVEVQRWARRDKINWYKIQAKCLDFVLVDSASFAPRLVIELDDRSHDHADRRERDAFVDDVLASAGIPMLHVRWQRSYDTQALAEQIAATLGLASPAIVSPVAATLVVTPPQPAESFCAPIAPVDATVAAATPTPASHASALPVRAPVGANLADAPPAPMRRACGHCQADLREAAKFCSNCGAVFSS